MPIEVYELQDDSGKISERESTHSGKREWIAKGTFVHDEAHAAIRAEVDETIEVAGETLYLDAIDVESVEADIWQGVANYISEEAKGKQEKKNEEEPEEGEIIWEFDTTGATHHITSSYETRHFGEFGSPDNEVTTRLSNAINVKKTKTGFDIKGVDVIVPALEISATFSVPPGEVTIDWIKDVARATGKTNSLAWKGFEPGELLFKGGRIREELSDKTVIVFTFSASENIVAAHNIKIGNIGPITKAGHAYLWVEYENRDGTDEAGRPYIFPAARYAYVEKIYLDFDFNGLGTP
jgi:hypothetical protein